MNRRDFDIFFSIARKFAAWCSDSDWACAKGCASCCTQNVAMTTLEGKIILAGLKLEGRLAWLQDRLRHPLTPIRPYYTFNTMARACLAGKSLPEEPSHPRLAPCPFLDNSCCSIYPLRPFACRAFHSTSACTPLRHASVAPAHLAAATAVSQLLEHLTQRQPWGNMLDLLPALLEGDANSSHQAHLLRAQPLPGFLLGPAEQESVALLIDSILATPVAGRSIGDILNGK